MEYNIQMQNYEGPFDLLLELLQKDKINICDISIVEITNQYMEQLKELEQVLDMEKMYKLFIKNNIRAFGYEIFRMLFINVKKMF